MFHLRVVRLLKRSPVRRDYKKSKEKEKEKRKRKKKKEKRKKTTTTTMRTREMMTTKKTEKSRTSPEGLNGSIS